MSNELIWIIFAIVNFLCIVTCYYLFGEKGLFAWIALGTILANIQVIKTVELFGLSATLGNIMYGTLFLATDVLNENHNQKSATKAVYVGFFVNITSIIIMQIAIWFEPLTGTEMINDSLRTIFSILPRIFVASLIAYIVSQLLDVILFQKIRKRWPSIKMLWLRNNVATLISQAIDTLIFVTIAFIGSFETKVFWEIMLTTYVIKAMVSLLDTPFVYWMSHIKPLRLWNHEKEKTKE